MLDAVVHDPAARIRRLGALMHPPPHKEGAGDESSDQAHGGEAVQRGQSCRSMMVSAFCHRR